VPDELAPDVLAKISAEVSDRVRVFVVDLAELLVGGWFADGLLRAHEQEPVAGLHVFAGLRCQVGEYEAACT
jgi:hypothetical protein